jgi:hypothetical protein
VRVGFLTQKVWNEFVRSSKVISFPRDYTLRREKLVRERQYLTACQQARNSKAELFISVYSDYEVKNNIVSAIFYDVDLDVERQDVVEYGIKKLPVLKMVRSYYSGRRGYHIYIDVDPVRVGDLRSVALAVAEVLGIADSLDKKVVGDWRRMSRVPLTYHAVTGLEVIPINSSTSQELSTEVRELLQRFSVKKPGIAIPYELPIKVVEVGDPPDCIKYIIGRAMAGINLRHEERMHLGAFLLKMGLKPEEITPIFSTVPDYKEEITLYNLRWLSERNYNMYSCRRAKELKLCPLPNTTCKYYPSPNWFF